MLNYIKTSNKINAFNFVFVSQIYHQRIFFSLCMECMFNIYKKNTYLKYIVTIFRTRIELAILIDTMASAQL